MKQPIKQMLDNYAKSDAIRLHMPANRGKFPLYSDYDITELPFSDDLSNPQGVIALSQAQTATLFSCKGCRYLVNGSTVGILAMVACAKGRLYVQRNSHKSLFSALRIFRKEAYVEDNMNGDFSSCAVTLAQVASAVENHNVQTVFLTSPDYFGLCADVKSIYEYCQKKGVLLFIDGAHGGHHALSELLPDSVSEYSDAAVISAHKDLGALTQTAILTYNNCTIAKEIIRQVNALTSSSPSYLLLESIERAVFNAFSDAKAYSVTAQLRSRLQTQTAGFVRYKPNDDFTRVVIDATYANANGKDLYDYLVSQKIFGEFYTGNYCILLLSTKDDESTICALANALINFAKVEKPNANRTDAHLIKFDKSGLLCNNFSSTHWVSLNDSVGMIAADCIGVAPPCIPVVLSGQTITAQAVEFMRDKQLFNVYDGKIEVAE